MQTIYKHFQEFIPGLCNNTSFNNVQCTLLAVADHISEMNICSWALWAEQESQGKFGQSSGNWPLLEMQPATQHRGPVLPQLHICTGILANLI